MMFWFRCNIADTNESSDNTTNDTTCDGSQTDPVCQNSDALPDLCSIRPGILILEAKLQPFEAAR